MDAQVGLRLCCLRATKSGFTVSAKHVKRLMIWGNDCLTRPVDKLVLQTENTHLKCHITQHFTRVCIVSKVRKMAKIRNRYNPVPHLTNDITRESDKTQLNIPYESQEVSFFKNKCRCCHYSFDLFFFNWFYLRHYTCS